MSLQETRPDADLLATPLSGMVDASQRPEDGDPVEARGILDAVAARMFGAAAQPVRVGRFVLLERIGRGGMGVVYAAYDPQLDRKIAIKLLTAPGEDDGLGAGDAVARDADDRLVREARAAARLDHPNVVTIHEVGTWEGRVFLAMEFIDGATLKAWLGARPRTPDEILGVFVQAGRGLAAAHAAGVVHRDFKPENVLVGRDDVVRVVDFGLARASARDDALASLETSSPPSSSSTALARAHANVDTRTGAIMGTPAYMAPEQHRGEPADAAADQFGFCVALWEAWYGARPFAGQSLGALALAVTEGRITPPPADTAEPARLRRILERGLATAPHDRHASMDALLDALADDPGRRRRRVAFGGAAGVALVGAGLLIGRAAPSTSVDPCGGGVARMDAVWNDTRRDAVARAFEATERPYAAAALAQVQERLDARATGWIAGHRDACEATTVRGEQSDALLDLRMACLDRRLAELDSLATLLVEADAQSVARVLRSLDGLAPIDACADATALRAPVQLPEDPTLRAEIVAVQDEITRGGQLRDLGRFADAIAAGTRSVARAEALGHAPTLADALALLGSAHALAGELATARPILEEAVWTAIAGRNALAHASASGALVTLTGHAQEDVAAGERWGRHARAVLRAMDDPPARLALLEGNLGNVAMTRGDRPAALAHFRESERLYESAYGPDDANTGRMLANVAVVLRQQGHLDLAEHAYARALDVLERSLGPGHPDVGPVLSNSGSLAFARGRLDDALTKYRAALAVGEAALEPMHPQLGHAHNNIGETLLELGDPAEAELHVRQAIAIWEHSLTPRHSLLASPYGVLGRSLLARGRVDESIAALEHALSLPTSAAVSSSDLAVTRFALARALWHDPAQRARALALAAEARAAQEGHTARIAELDAWVAERSGSALTADASPATR